MQISREDYDKVSEEINKRFQEEIIFDQLVTTVIEWHEAMVKFAARSDAASVSSYPTMLKKIRECSSCPNSGVHLWARQLGVISGGRRSEY